MTPTELADAVTDVVENIRARIEGVGAEQYDLGEQQRIETYTADRLLREAIEEVDDCLVYVAVLRLRLERLRGVMNGEVD